MPPKFHPNPSETRYHGQRVQLPAPPLLPILSPGNYNAAIQYLMKTDYLRDGRRRALMAIIHKTELAVLEYLIRPPWN